MTKLYPILVDILFEKDVNEYIYSLIKYPQCSDLLNDIVNFKYVYDELLYIYHDIYINLINGDNEEEDLEWLINDLILFCNNNKPTMDGYNHIFYMICMRNIRLKSKKDVDNYINKLLGKKLKYQINFFLGLLKPKERMKFLDLSKEVFYKVKDI